MHFSATEFWSLAVAAIFVQNSILVLMLYTDNYWALLHRPRAGLLYGCCVTVWSTLASALAWALNYFLLARFGMKFLEPFAYVLVVALLEVCAEIVLWKYRPRFRKKLGKLLPESAFSFAVLGLVFFNIQSVQAGFLGTVFYGFCAGVGFILALLLNTAALEKTQFSSPPAAFKGLPLALLTASVLSLAFLGFMNIQIPY